VSGRYTPFLKVTPMAKRKPTKGQYQPSSPERLRESIEEATVDSNGVEEALMGFEATLQDNVTCPFHAKVIGEEVEVLDLRGSANGRGIDAICKKQGKEYPIDIRSLEWIDPRPQGFEWIEAYLSWSEGL
jgi:Calcium binding